MIILGIESSCDETAVAIVKDKKELKVIENNETFKMSCDDKHIILESNDKND